MINYSVTIEGHLFRVMEFSSGYISFGAPMGNSEFERAMFDELVYYRKRLYNGLIQDKEEIIDDLVEFIRDYKRANYKYYEPTERNKSGN